jgi:hypothetical protein
MSRFTVARDASDTQGGPLRTAARPSPIDWISHNTSEHAATWDSSGCAAA